MPITKPTEERTEHHPAEHLPGTTCPSYPALTRSNIRLAW